MAEGTLVKPVAPEGEVTLKLSETEAAYLRVLLGRCYGFGPSWSIYRALEGLQLSRKWVPADANCPINMIAEGESLPKE